MRKAPEDRKQGLATLRIAKCHLMYSRLEYRGEINRTQETAVRVNVIGMR